MACVANFSKACKCFPCKHQIGVIEREEARMQNGGAEQQRVSKPADDRKPTTVLQVALHNTAM